MTIETIEPLIIPKQRERVTNRDWRRHNANLALDLFAEETTIIMSERNQVVICWPKPGSSDFFYRRWLTRGGDFYPVWSHKWPYGGTSCTALSQLVRWIQGRPVLPLSTWRYWCGPRVQLARDRGDALIARLVHAQYPERAHCVLCGRLLESFDWWSLNKVSGPACNYTEGCRQKPTEKGNPS